MIFKAENFKNKKYKIILSGCMTIALIFIISIVSIVITNNKETAIQKANSKLNYFEQINDSRTDTAHHILSAMQSDSNILEYVNTHNRYSVIAIQNKLRFFTAVEDIFRFKLNIIEPKNNLFITSNTIKYNYTDYENYSEKSGYVINNEYTDIYFKTSYYGDTELIFICKLYKNIDNFLLTEGSEKYFILCSNSLVYGDEKFQDYIADFINFKKVKSSDIICTSASKSNPDFTYVYMKKNIVSPFSILTLTIISLLILILAYILTNILYGFLNKTIKDVTRKVSTIADISLNDENTDDIDVIISKLKETFRGLNEIKQANIDNTVLLNQKNLIDLYSGLLSEHNIRKLINTNLPLLNKPHTLISVLIINERELSEEYGTDGIIYIRKDIIDMILEKFTNVYYFIDRMNGFTILTTENTKKVIEMMSNLAEILLAQFHITLKACIGQTVCGYTESLKSYTNIKNLISNILFQESDKVIFMENSDVTKIQPCIYSIETEQQIINLFVEEKFYNAKVLLENVIIENITSTSSNSSLQKLQHAFEVTIQRIADCLSINIDNIIHADIPFDKMSVKEIRITFIDMFDRLINEIQNMGEPSDNDYTKIYNFINNNINTDVSLNDLADHLGYSLWKTSRKFKELFNENFKTYVIMRKINLAKELLLQDYSVIEVATSIGCNSAATFIRMFKSNLGITPGEFKKNCSTTSTDE